MITPVHKIMTKNLLTVPSGSSVLKASELMLEKRIRHLPVTDEKGDIIGLVSQRDLSLVSDPHLSPVDFIMSAPVYSVDQDLPLRQVVYRMLQMKISSLLITNDSEEVVGIVTTDDLLWFLAHLLGEESEMRLPVPSAQSLQTIGQVANSISNMGL